MRKNIAKGLAFLFVVMTCGCNDECYGSLHMSLQNESFGSDSSQTFNNQERLWLVVEDDYGDIDDTTYGCLVEPAKIVGIQLIGKQMFNDSMYDTLDICKVWKCGFGVGSYLFDDSYSIIDTTIELQFAVQEDSLIKRQSYIYHAQ